MPTFEIVSQGEELVSGATVDTNAAWMARELSPLGLEPGWVTVVGDDREAIAAALAAAAARAEVLVCTGGLGPTTDDLTTEAAAAAFGVDTYEDAEALGQVLARYRSRGREMPPSNRKQAVLPRGATLLENRWGTAPGYRIDTPRGVAFFLPGVPSEMRAMFHAWVLPAVTARFQLPPRRTIVLRCIGLAESVANERMAGFERPGVTVGYRAHLPEIHVKLHVSPGVEVAPLIDEARRRLGSRVFTVDGGSLAEVVGTMLAARGESVATAESCTGGRIASMITSVPGSSAWFPGGVVVYANAEKVRQCGVPEALLASVGAVSEEVARALAEGVAARVGATWGIGVTGIAGPGGGTVEKPVGTVHVAVAGPGGTSHRLLQLPAGGRGGPFEERERIQVMSSALALDQLRRRLEGAPS